MNKKNVFATKLRQQRRLWLDVQRRFTIQQCIDVAEITLHDYFGWGAKRLKEFEEKFRQEMSEYILMALQDDQEDRSINYTKGKLDQRLRKIFRDESIYFEDRYPAEIK